MGFNVEEVVEAVKTARSSGAVGPNAKVPQIVLEMAYDNRDWILDYGAGRKAIHTEMLREAGYGNAWAYDFAKDVDGVFIDDLETTRGEWDIIFASNVLNVQTSMGMLDLTLNELWQLMNPFSILVANYPNSPRKLDLSVQSLHSKLREGFERVHRTHVDVFVCSRPVDTSVRPGVSSTQRVENKSLARLAKLMLPKKG